MFALFIFFYADFPAESFVVFEQKYSSRYLLLLESEDIRLNYSSAE